jgi:hypothetical protein
MIASKAPLYKRYAIDSRYEEVSRMARKDGATMVHLAVEPELQRRIAEFRHDNYISTKTAAWKWLVKAALDAGLRPSPEEVEEMKRAG